MPNKHAKPKFQHSVLIMLKFIKSNFWIVFLVSAVIGLFIPKLSFLSDYVIFFLGLIMFLTFLKIDIKEIIKNIKNFPLITYILFFNIIIFPILTFLIFKTFNSNLLIAAVLMAAMPTAISAASISKLINADISLTLIITILSSLISIITIPLTFYLLLNKIIAVDYISMLITLLLIIVLPILIAQLLKKRISSMQFLKNSDILIIILLAFIIIGIMAKGSNSFFEDIGLSFTYIIITILIYLFFQIIGYFSVFWKSHKEKLTASNSKVSFNAGLGMVLAITYFGPKVSLIVALSEFGYILALATFKLYKK